MNLESITELSNHFKMVDNEIQRMENHKIEKLLKFLNVPEKGENLISIEECLKWERIGIYLPERIFNTINFDLLTLPKKVKFHSNLHDDKIYIFNQNNQEHFPYPAKMDRINFIKNYMQDVKIEFPFHSIDFLKSEMCKF